MDFSDVTILCIGDVMLDRFLHGDIERISPEAPVPVIRLKQTREMLGGTGNVAHNISSLGGRAILIGLVANDEPGRTVARLVDASPRITSSFVETKIRPTVCKTRFLAGRQQVVRADEESQLAIQPEEEGSLLAAIDLQVGHVQGIILSDYGKGVLSSKVIEAAIQHARAARIPVFVDPKSDDFSRYKGATCITPNLKELASAAKLPVGTEDQVVVAATRVMAEAEAAAILTTRSEKGMVLVEASGETHCVPTRAREVFDVSGAGDTVIATLALAHASGRTLSQSMHIANAAAGVVVSKLGTATVDLSEIMHELSQQDDEIAHAVAGLVPLKRAEDLVARWKEQALTVGFTNGCFDILHSGHIALLSAARAQCDRLVVALNSDDSVRRLKGQSRPIHTLSQRAQVMAAIRHVDCVVCFDDDTPLALIERLLPDVLIKGSDYSVETVVGAKVVQAAGGRIFLADLIPGQSTTNVVDRLRVAG